MRRQFFDLRPGESVEIGNSRVTAEAKTGARIRIRVESDEPTHKASAPVARPTEEAPSGAPFMARPRMP